ncbi:MAG: putative CRISPR-associated protein [Acidobacteria bacterium]|nr:putative CRISPR-associated protein [Acidobacteriota bacterium]
MSRQVICTVGTSLLTNGERPWAGWSPQRSLPQRDDVVDWLRTADLERASAETNTIRALDLGEADTLALLHSDTSEGCFCADALGERYRSQVVAVSVEKVGRLGYGADDFTAGLKGLVDITLRLIREANQQHRQPVLCATGGFKAEIALLNLLGALLEIEVVYIHERHRKLVRLPRLPLRWNDEFVLRHEDFFRWIDEEPRSSKEVESWLRANPSLRLLVEDDAGGHTLLTAAGDLLFRAARERRDMGPRAMWPDADPRPPAQTNGLSGVEHHRPSGWQRFLDRLCHIDCVKHVRYDEAARGGPKVKVIDADGGILGVRFGEPGAELPLRVETTARGVEQCDLVGAYFRTLR